MIEPADLWTALLRREQRLHTTLPEEIIARHSADNVKMLNSRMQALQKGQRSGRIEIDQDASDVIVERVSARLDGVTDVVVEDERCAGPQLRLVLQGEFQTA